MSTGIPPSDRGCSTGEWLDLDENGRRQHLRDQAVIHAMLDFHREMEREVEELPNGIRSITRSSNVEVVKLLHDHVPAMVERMRVGRPLRRWDPLYRAYYEQRDQIQIQVEMTDDGVSVEEVSDSPSVAQLIKARSATVDRFISEGFPAAQRTHPVPDDPSA